MNTRNTRPVVAVTGGDPAGVGPEIIEALFSEYRPTRSLAVVIGARTVFATFLRRLEVEIIERISDHSLPARGVVFLDTGCRERYRTGRDSRGGGEHAGRILEQTCRLARAGSIDGIVTSPISKNALNLAGRRFAGHTEMLARRLRAPDCQMMMVYRDFRVVPLTRHLPLRIVSKAVTRQRITTCVEVVTAALRTDFGIRKPHLAVAGLNPHAGEEGLFGSEEADTISPAVKQLRRRGFRIEGPVPADALFQKAQSGTFDAFIAMYHDQGLVPFKMLAKRRGVNVTVGLPVVRTSVDHGVAYDIAGTGRASSTSLRAAYQMAEKLVLVRGQAR
ncbi:MAG: 4-hydroxythreonine-4-phosphate dehydrogenase PdxA [bacterium]|nr:4-hydroxythreonine-4-phosphate dehydrogenase PdxA [bacterium]